MHLCTYSVPIQALSTSFFLSAIVLCISMGFTLITYVRMQRDLNMAFLADILCWLGMIIPCCLGSSHKRTRGAGVDPQDTWCWLSYGHHLLLTNEWQTDKWKKVINVHTLDIAPLRSESPPQKRSGMARVLKGFHSFTCTTTCSSAIGMSHTCLCLPSYSWYSFTYPGGVQGWVKCTLKACTQLWTSSDNWQENRKNVTRGPT